MWVFATQDKLPLETDNIQIHHFKQHSTLNTLQQDNTRSTHETRKTRHKHYYNYNPYIQYQHTNRSLQDKIPHPKYTSNIQKHSLQNNIHVSNDHCGSPFEPGASGLPYYLLHTTCMRKLRWVLSVSGGEGVGGGVGGRLTPESPDSTSFEPLKMD